MNYRILGRTGLRVSEISLGTAEIGMAYGLGAESQPAKADAARLLHQALDLGINLIDTARAYGESEAIIGEVLRERRDEYFLVSKSLVGRRDDVIQSAHESLKTLRTDTIDIMMLHSAAVPDIESGEAAGALLDLKQHGTVRYVGASVYGNEAAEAAIRAGCFDCLQVAYSVLDRRPERGLAEKAAQAGVGLVARSVLLKGALTDRRRALPAALSAVQNAVEVMAGLASTAGCTLPELAYRYALSTGVVQTALVGASHLDEAADAVRFAAAGPLPPTVIEQIRASAELDEWFLNPGNWPAM